MISVIICSIDPARFAAISEHYRRLLVGEPHEIIGIHDALSMGEGYNRGCRQSRGDLVIFSHDDIEILAADFGARVKQHLTRYDLIGVAGTTRLIYPAWAAAGPPHVYGQVAQVNAVEQGFDVLIWGVPAPAVGGIQALDGVFLAARRQVIDRVGFDERTYQGFHLYDIDFSFSAHLAGFRLAVCGDLCLIHASQGQFDEDWRRQAQQFVLKHRGRLPAVELRPYSISCVKVKTRQEILEVMHPPHWQA